MTVYQEITDALVEAFSSFVDDRPMLSHFEFAVAFDQDQCEAIEKVLTDKYPGVHFHVGEPSPDHVRSLMDSGWLDEEDE